MKKILNFIRNEWLLILITILLGSITLIPDTPKSLLLVIVLAIMGGMLIWGGTILLRSTIKNPLVGNGSPAANAFLITSAFVIRWFGVVFLMNATTLVWQTFA